MDTTAHPDVSVCKRPYLNVVFLNNTNLRYSDLKIGITEAPASQRNLLAGEFDERLSF